MACERAGYRPASRGWVPVGGHRDSLPTRLLGVLSTWLGGRVGSVGHCGCGCAITTTASPGCRGGFQRGCSNIARVSSDARRVPGSVTRSRAARRQSPSGLSVGDQRHQSSPSLGRGSPTVTCARASRRRCCWVAVGVTCSASGVSGGSQRIVVVAGALTPSGTGSTSSGHVDCVATSEAIPTRPATRSS